MPSHFKSVDAAVKEVANALPGNEISSVLFRMQSSEVRLFHNLSFLVCAGGYWAALRHENRVRNFAGPM